MSLFSRLFGKASSRSEPQVETDNADADPVKKVVDRLPLALLGLWSCVAFAESASIGAARSGPPDATHPSRLLYTWKLNALTFGEDIFIYADGTFKSRKWCDICQPMLIAGRWSEDAEGVSLKPNDGTQKSRHLALIVRGPCHFLSESAAHGDKEAIFSFSVYFRDDEHCEIDSDGVARKL